MAKYLFSIILIVLLSFDAFGQTHRTRILTNAADITENKKGQFLGPVSDEAGYLALNPDGLYDWFTVINGFEVGGASFSSGNYYWNGTGWDVSTLAPNFPEGILRGMAQVGQIHRDSVVFTATQTKQIVTGHDLTTSGCEVNFGFKDVGTRPWPNNQLDCKEIVEAGMFFIWNFDNDFIRADIDDATTGTITFTTSGRATEYFKSSLEAPVAGVSNRIGDWQFSYAGRTPEEGYLAAVGVVVNGAIDYPIYASRRPELVADNGLDLDFTGFEGVVIRNLGGNADDQRIDGIQDFATNVDGITVVDANPSGRQTNRRTGGSNAAHPNETNTTRTLQGGAIETRMKNIADQLYAIVDTYLEASPVNSTGSEEVHAGNLYFSAALDFASLTSQNIGTQTGFEVFQTPTNNIRWHTGAGVTIGQVQAAIPTVSTINLVSADGQSSTPGVPSLSGDAYIFSLNAAQTALTARALN